MAEELITEKDFLATVVEMATALGWLAYHTHDSRRSQPGFPDLVLVKSNRLIFAELKRHEGVLSGFQRQWISALERLEEDAEVDTYVWWPSDLARIEAILQGREEEV